MQRISQFFSSFLDGVSPIFSTMFLFFCYVMFPDEAYIPAAGAVLAMMLIDIITKIYALKRPYKNYLEAIKEGVIRSSLFFEGTKKKLVVFMYLMIMCGLSYRVAPASKVTVFLGTFVYSMMFIRESQSCVENLIDSGHDLQWLMVFLRKKEKKVKDDEDGKN